MEDKLDQVVSQVVDTFRFHGVEIVRLNFQEGDPSFDIKISRKRMTKSLNETLDFVYWTLWTLIYGTYDKIHNSHLKINLNYIEVE